MPLVALLEVPVLRGLMAPMASCEPLATKFASDDESWPFARIGFHFEEMTLWPTRYAQ